MWTARALTLFPEMFPGPLGESLAGKALKEGVWSLEAVDIRRFAKDRHGTVDDAPFGGGAGMVMKPDVLSAAIEAVALPGVPKVLLSPRGAPFSQAGGRGVRAWCWCAGGSRASTSASSRPRRWRRSRSAISCFRAARSRPWR